MTAEEKNNSFTPPILSCKLCSYFKPTRRKKIFGVCKKANAYLLCNFAPICLAFSVEGFVRILEPVEVKNLEDLARKAPYDRNFINRLADGTCFWGGQAQAGTNETVRWTYTVPEGKKALYTLAVLLTYTPIATEGKQVQVFIKIENIVEVYLAHYSMTEPAKYSTTILQGIADAGTTLSGRTANNDTINHWTNVGLEVIEFDA